MEKFASIVMFPCKFFTCGCAASLLHTERRYHEEKTCEFRPYSCPCRGVYCPWKGPLEYVVPHLKMCHKSIKTLQGQDVLFTERGINVSGARSWVKMQSCFGHHFRLLLEKRVRFDGFEYFYVTVQLIGTWNQSQNFEYWLEMKSHRKCLRCEGVPISIHELVPVIIINSECLAFDARHVQILADDRDLNIHVSIFMM
jgi:E3 ubiquitin-protein ligase SIAH1